MTTGAVAWEMKPDSNITVLKLCEETERMLVATENGNILGLNMHSGEKEYVVNSILPCVYT